LWWCSTLSSLSSVVVSSCLGVVVSVSVIETFHVYFGPQFSPGMALNEWSVSTYENIVL
jgi:hypothetical protein